MWELDYTPHEIDDLRDILPEVPGVIKTRKRYPAKKGDCISYIDEVIGFDTENSSWRVDMLTGRQITQDDIKAMTPDERLACHVTSVPRCCSYAQPLAVRGRCCLLRGWEDFARAVDILREHFKPTPWRRLIIWVYNLPYDFQFFRKKFGWAEVFSVGDRSVVRALTVDGIEFRDALVLGKMKLAEIAERLRGYEIRKLVGDLDYSKIRHSRTPLTDAEKAYCVNDALILTAYIDNKRDEDGSLAKIPMTDTGYVRRDTRAACLRVPKEKARRYVSPRTGKTCIDYSNREYIRMIRSLTLTVEDYRLNKDCFAGAVTHANAHHVGKVLKNVGSFDFKSDYPGRQASEKYPCSAWQVVEDIRTEADVRQYSEAGYCVEFRCVIGGLREKVTWEHVLSASRCTFPHEDRLPKGRWDGVRIDNGRVISARCLATAMTEVDMEYLSWFYTWDSFTILEARVSKADYLPKEFLEAVLYFYRLKSELKGVPGRELDLIKSKGELNSEYGMLVMDIIRQICEYVNDGWSFTDNDEKTWQQYEEELQQYNDDPQRFTYYSWGVYVTAWARYWLCDMIRRLEPYWHSEDDENGPGFYSDYVYADTDSIKLMHPERYKALFEEVNATIRGRVRTCLETRGIDVKLGEPSNKKGVPQPIGVWDYEGTYYRFKTLGAKRYIVERDFEEKSDAETMKLPNGHALEATVAGCNKKNFSSWLAQKEKPFEVFRFGLNVPNEVCGRMICQYLDDKIGGDVTDYLGNRWVYVEDSGVYMEPSDYCLTVADEYRDLLQSLNLT